jgi:6-pyruvoyltetrahydropterin/6-carboxytetrahydropterin synthase
VVALTRRYRFSASHRLHSPALSDEGNAALYGKCNHPFGHGHDYILEVTVEGPVDPRTGLIVPLARLDELVQQRVLQLFASRYINVDVPDFAELVPTTENMVRVITRILLDGWRDAIGNGVALRRIHIRETGRNSFEILIGRPAGLVTQGGFANAESKII